MVLMVYDSEPNAAKTCFVHVKSGGHNNMSNMSARKNPIPLWLEILFTKCK